MSEDDDMLTVRDVARACGRSEETVRRWVWSGKLRARKLGNQLFVARGDLTAMRGGRVGEAVAAYAPVSSVGYTPVRYDSSEALAALERAVAYSGRFGGRFAGQDAGEMVNESRKGH